MPIPRIVWQTYSCPKEELPSYLKAISSTWEQSGLEYKYISNQYIFDFILNNYDKEIVDIINYIEIPMVKADFFRLVMLYEFGGLYADIDTILLNPVDDWIDFNKDLFLLERTNEIHLIKNDLFASSPKNPIIKEILEEVIKRCKEQMLSNAQIFPDHTGPPVFDFIIKKHNLEHLRNNGLYSYKLENNYMHIGGLTLKDNIDFFRYNNSKAFDFKYLNSLYNDIDMEKIDIKLYIKKSGYGS
jgi:mannosyltransferase OCH1-like enzyme